ncbi:hypothetical protein [Aquimarina agarivorans]|uniref:hypothetical protein n=1 Tax=Aquimarina agarivorans TaxID=980584 RepID=UPI0002D4389C|nr:hypothetical protein [Aquimarina agarivorans]
MEILDTPTLNWLNRPDLTETATNSSGVNITIGSDIDPIIDPKLGNSSFPGSYDTQHLAPVINVRNTAKVKEGDVLRLSGYHALPTADGQISASWNNPAVYRRMRKIHEKLYTDFKPDGFLLNYSEIRMGGW